MADQRPSVLFTTPTSQRPAWPGREPLRSAPVREAVRPVAEPVRNAPTPTRRKRVLVVDDNETIVSILKEFLAEGYQVDGASNAEAALAAVGSHTPDAILLDLNMPGMDGMMFLEALRGRGIGIPIFIMTGYDEPGLAERAKDSGATAFLVKPVNLRELDRRLATTLRVPPLVTK